MQKILYDMSNINTCHVLSNYKPEDILYFDIETTGFSPSKTSLYLIGCAYISKETTHLLQWFCDSEKDESDVIKEFLQFIKNFKAIVHYNGSGFDIPYIIKKCGMLDIPCDLSGIESIDIYKLISPLKEIFKIENLKQKSVEKFMDISREDKYSGGELIKFYNEYVLSKDNSLKELLLMHNRDDVIGITKLLPILNYTALLDNEFEVKELTISSDEKDAVITLTLPFEVPKRVSYGNDKYYFTAYSNIFKINIKIYSDELKFFYPDYKNYYYLPAEDRSIHKSVAFYVDKNFRTKAKAANCYSKKTGHFLPQYEEIISPYFKIDYYDKITYFELTDDFINNKASILKYVNHIITILLS